MRARAGKSELDHLPGCDDSHAGAPQTEMPDLEPGARAELAGGRGQGLASGGEEGASGLSRPMI